MLTERLPSLLNTYAVIHIDGIDAEKFLQSQLSCDVVAMLPDQCQLSAYCNQKGYVESLFWLQRTHSGFRALIDKTLIDSTMALFKKYGAFSNVTCHIHSLIPEQFSLAHQETPLSWNEYLTLALPMPPLMAAQVTQATQWRAYFLSHGIPLLTAATAGLFRPHELHLPTLGAVSFSKGCYPGQEIVARMQYRGKAKAHAQALILSECTTAPTAGANLMKDATVIDCLLLKEQTYRLSAVMPDLLYEQLPFVCPWGQLSQVSYG